MFLPNRSPGNSRRMGGRKLNAVRLFPLNQPISLLSFSLAR